MATAKKKSTAKKSAVKKPAAKKTAKKPAKKATAKKPAAKKAASTKAPARKATKRAPNPAFMKPMQPDAALAAVIGSKPMPRSEVAKQMWVYIKKHNLQDAKQRRMINADDKLRPVFNGKRQVSMFEMTKLVNQHMS